MHSQVRIKFSNGEVGLSWIEVNKLERVIEKVVEEAPPTPKWMGPQTESEIADFVAKANGDVRALIDLVGLKVEEEWPTHTLERISTVALRTLAASSNTHLVRRQSTLPSLLPNLTVALIPVKQARDEGGHQVSGFHPLSLY